MYGMVNRAMEQMVVEAHGEELWQRICRRAGCEVDHFVRLDPYPDELTYALVGAAAEELEAQASDLLHTFGGYWIGYAQRSGYGEMFRAVDSYAVFLQHLDSMHTRLQLSFTGLKAPQFSCVVEAPVRLQVVYRSHRVGLAPFIVGLLEALGPVFKVTAWVEHVRSKPPGEPGAEEHFVITLANA